MRVLIVAKTRRGAGACVGGITAEGKSVRLVAVNASTNQHAGLEYEVGEVWEVDWAPDTHIVPPHVENTIVLRAWRLKQSVEVEKAVLRFMPPVAGGPEKLFDGRLQSSGAKGLYIAQRSGLPGRSTMFWRPDRDLALDYEGKRIRYRYPSEDGGRAITFVGFQEPVETIPAGTLVRVSLAHWWRPADKPEQELRCYVQLSGWFPCERAASAKPPVAGVGNKASPMLTSADRGLQVDRARLVPRDDSDTTVQMGASERGHCCPPFSDAHTHGQEYPRADAGLGRAREVLKQTFGFNQFLPVQGEVVAHVLQGRDTLAVMPTGGGKSLCYQLPAMIREGLTVVVSPLIALMQDQVSQLRQLAIPAAFLNCTVPLHEYTAIMNRVRRGEMRLLYIAPETLLRPETLLLMEQSHLTCLAVDEAHCISEWGHDFRPEYRQLEAVRRRFPRAVCLALTATATGRVREDIRRLLGIAADGQFVASFNRRNLFLAAEPRTDGLAQTLAFLEAHRGQAGIIYCGKRRQVDELSASLNANGWPALPYHAGLDDKVRAQNQEQFIHDKVPLIVATIAFGLGINKPNVRFVLHYNMPKDLEGYYQEIGRGGRDGLPAECLLLYSWADAMVHRHFIDQGAESQCAGRHARLNALMDYAEARGCRRVPLLAYFGEVLKAPCGCCDRCVPRVRTTAAHAIIRPVRKRRCDDIGALFQAGHTLEEIAQRYSIQRSTVLANLYQFQQDRGRLEARRLLDISALSEGERGRVLAAFERLGLERLGPVHEALDGTVGYDELHLLRLYALCRVGAPVQQKHPAPGSYGSRSLDH